MRLAGTLAVICRQRKCRVNRLRVATTEGGSFRRGVGSTEEGLGRQRKGRVLGSEEMS